MLALGDEPTLERLLGDNVDDREPRRTELALDIMNREVDLRTATLETAKQSLLKAYRAADSLLDGEAA